MNKMTREEARDMLRAFFPQSGRKFLVELEFTQDLNTKEQEDLAIKIMESMSKGTEILPGLKVSRAFNKACSLDTVALDQSIEEIDLVKEKIQNSIQELETNLIGLKKVLEHRNLANSNSK